MGILIRVRKVSKEPKSIEDLKDMANEMDSQESDTGDIKDPGEDVGDSTKNDKTKSDGDVKPDENGGMNPQDRNSDIEDIGDTNKKIERQKFSSDPFGILGMKMDMGEQDDMEEKESLKMFLRGLLGLL